MNRDDVELIGSKPKIRIPAIIVGLVVVGFLSYLTARVQMLPPRLSLGRSHFPWPPPLILLGMIFIVNGFLFILSWLFGRKVAFSGEELLTIFAMSLSTVAIPTYGLMMHLCTRFGGLSYIADRHPEAHLEEICGPYFPSSLLEPSSPQAVKWYYEGLPSGKSIPWDIPWGAWITPLLMWLLFVAFMYMLFLSLSTILSRQWVDNEKLPFPAAQVPLAMVSEDGWAGPALRSSIFWIGFLVPFLIHSYNALSSLSPDLGTIPLNVTTWEQNYLSEPPWSALRPLRLFIFPSGIAFIFLISKEVSFSILAFYFVQKFLVVIAYYLGIAESHNDFIASGLSFFSGQATGAMIVMAGMGFWIAREHIKRVFAGAFSPRGWLLVCGGSLALIVAMRAIEHAGLVRPHVGLAVSSVVVLLAAALLRNGKANDRDEIMPYRIATVGLLLSIYGMIRWMELIGASPLVAVFIVFILMVIALALTRLVTEGGLLHMKAHVDPVNLSKALVGVQGLGPHNLAALSTVKWGFMFELPAFLMPSLMNSIKIGKERRFCGRRLGVSLVLAIAVAVLVSFYTYVTTCYEVGIARTWKYLYFTWTFSCWDTLAQEIRRAMEHPGIVPNWSVLSYMGLGGVVMFLLYFVRQRFGWGLHPLGYVAWISPYQMSRLWFSILVGWLLKSLIVKFGGYKTYEGIKPFFIGVIAGECSAVTIWSLASYMQWIPAYKFFG